MQSHLKIKLFLCPSLFRFDAHHTDLTSNGTPARPTTILRVIRSMAMVLNYKKHRPWAENLSIVLQIGLTMAGCIIFCFFTGYYLDRWAGSHGILTVLLTVFGIIGGGVVSYRQIMEVFADGTTKDSGSEHGID